MKISVTEEDIADSKKAGICPVELALHRLGFPKAKVGANFIWHVANRDFDHPPEVMRFIRAFDSGKLVQPFTFDLPV